MTAEIDRRRCPLCNEPNGCGLLEGSPKCWCFTASISKAALERVPEAARDIACLCRACAEGKLITAPRSRKD